MDEDRSGVKLREFSTEAGCEIEVPGPVGLVIFGASGDLTKRKIIPSLYRLNRNNFLPEDFFVLGTARTEMTREGFREEMREAVKAVYPEDFDESSWEGFAQRLYYQPVDYDSQESYRAILKSCRPLQREHRTGGNLIIYLAVPPTVYETIITNIGVAGLAEEDDCYTHIVIEKPFGRDLESARRLNGILRTYFKEPQIYRMDHYLAKETVQDILMFRFANSIFEPLWNRRYIDHVQITVSETIGVEHRAGYYEKAGVLRDMFQNHIFQLLALVAMEPPSVFEAERVRDEKVKVFRSIRPFPLDRLGDCVAAGQYGKGAIDDSPAAGYREEPGIAPDSTIPTFAALRVLIDNWRWNGVPFYLRSGKRLPRRKAEISIHYKPVPHLMFAKTLEERIEPNMLALRVQPDEGISLYFQTKNPGAKVCLRPVLMDFSYPRVFFLSDYERILLDCMQGDQMLFVREDGVNQTWALLSPLIERLEAETKVEDFPNYASGSAGPQEADRLIEKDGRTWKAL
jgi:glucose-6-phosphate 1-dehydrogenase